MFEKVIFDILYYVIWAIELVGIGVIVVGTVYAIFKLFYNKYKNLKNKNISENGGSAKLVLANYLALGLEFLLASEILRTITTNREISEIIVLGAIIILRAAMSLLIYWELSYEEKKDTFVEKKKSRNSVKPL